MTIKPLVLLTVTLFTVGGYSESFAEEINSSKSPAKKASDQKIYDSDADLQGYPDYYKKRIKEFRNIIRKEKSREDKVKKAISLLNDEDSNYRKDAIGFLAEIRAKEAVPTILKVGFEKYMRPEVAYSLGEIRDERGVEFLIRCLYDENDNVRGNAIIALRKVTGMNFPYAYSDTEEKRKENARVWENWWLTNKDKFKPVEITEDEKKEAAEKWDRYGKGFMERLKSE